MKETLSELESVEASSQGRRSYIHEGVSLACPRDGVYGPICLRSVVSMAQCVHGPICLRSVVSMAQCVHGPMCPCPSVSMAQCVHGPMCPWPNVSLAQCVHGPMCPWPNVSMAQCVHGPVCLRPVVSTALCVYGPMCLWPNVSMAQCVHGPTCARPYVSITRRVHSTICLNRNNPYHFGSIFLFAMDFVLWQALQHQQVWCRLIFYRPTYALLAMCLRPDLPWVRCFCNGAGRLCRSACRKPMYIQLAEAVAHANRIIRFKQEEHRTRSVINFHVWTHQSVGKSSSFKSRSLYLSSY